MGLPNQFVVDSAAPFEKEVLGAHGAQNRFQGFENGG